MQRSDKIRIAAIALTAAIPILLGLRWALPCAFHQNTYNCDENSPIASLQAMDPAKLDFNPVGPKTQYALGDGTLHIYTYGASLKALSLAKLLTLTSDKRFYYENPGEWARFYLAGRALSAVYGVLSAVLLFFLGRAMFGRAAGTLAGLLLALAPVHTVYSRYLLVNGPGMFWVVLAMLLMKRLMDTGERRFYLLAAAAIGLAASTRYSAGPLFVPFLAAHLLGPGRRSGLKYLLLAAPVMAAAFLLGTPYAVLDFPSFVRGFGAMAGVVSNGVPAAGALAGLKTLASNFSDSLGVLLTAASAFGLVWAAARRTKDDILLAVWTLPLLAIFFKSAEAASGGRMLPAFPFLILLAARALTEAGRGLPAVRNAAVALIFAELLLLQAGAVRLTLGEDPRDAASRWLQDNVRPGASIGLLREPSWFSPGVVELKYRHPERKVLEGARFARLTSGAWETAAGYDRLGAEKPDFVISSSVEAGYVDEPALERKLADLDYVKAAQFGSEFSVFGVRLRSRVPKMFFIPDWIRVFARKPKG